MTWSEEKLNTNSYVARSLHRYCRCSRDLYRYCRCCPSQYRQPPGSPLVGLNLKNFWALNL